jgi:carbamoyltransferase
LNVGSGVEVSIRELWAGFPSQAIRDCLEEANLDLSDIDQIAINQNAKAHLWKKVAFLITNRPDLSFVFDRLKNKKKRINIEEEFLREYPESEINAEIKYIEHHHAHLASAHLVSPFKKSVVVSVDGFGDFASTAWGLGNNNVLDIDNRIYFPHSLGIFYQAMTQYLGFQNYGDVTYFKESEPDQVVRRFNSSHFNSDNIAWGWVPAHPSLF